MNADKLEYITKILRMDYDGCRPDAAVFNEVLRCGLAALDDVEWLRALLRRMTIAAGYGADDDPDKRLTAAGY